MNETKSFREQLAEARLAWKGPQLPADERIRTEFPLVWEILTCQLEQEGKLLEPARLSIGAGDGEWVLTVSDAALAQSFSVAVGSLVDALPALEAALARSAGHWRPYRNRKPKLKAPKAPAENPSQNGVAKPKKRK